MCKRIGTAKLRHVEIADLWTQDKIRDGSVALKKVLRTANPADLLTKYLDREAIHSHCAGVGVWSEAGRPRAAPQL